MEDQRTRILRYLRRESTEGIPFDIGFNPEAERRFQEKLKGKSEREYFECPVRSLHPDLIKAKRITGEEICRLYPDGVSDNSYIDEWGICTTERNGLVYVQNPMAGFETPEDLNDYPFPDYSRPECYSQAADQIRRFHEQGYAAIIKAERLIFAMGRDLRGYEQHMMDYYINEDLNEALLDRIMQCQIDMVKGMASTGADIIWLSSDVASQSNVFLRPSVYHEAVSWRMKAVYDAAKEVNPDILCAYHCCGNVDPIMPDILSWGIHILNPIQPESLNFPEFKRKYGDKIIFWGGLSVQKTFPFGSANDIVEEVRDAIHVLGDRGGYVVSPSNEITEDIPWENLEAFAEEARKYWK